MLPLHARPLLWTLTLAPGASACEKTISPRDASTLPWTDAETTDAALPDGAPLARHAEVHHVAPGPEDSLYFVATVNGPITHTADDDLSLGESEGLLGNVRRL
jgi:hypothetical protein